MTPAEYDAWLTRHMERHGPTDAVVVALNSWQFCLSCYDAATLEAASVRMLTLAVDDKPYFQESPADRHFRLLTAAIRAIVGPGPAVKRQEERRRQNEETEQQRARPKRPDLGPVSADRTLDEIFDKLRKKYGLEKKFRLDE